MTQETQRRIAAARQWLAIARADPTARRPPLHVRVPRFSRGCEREPIRLDRLHVGRFSEGAEAQLEASAQIPHVGRFSDGIGPARQKAPSELHIGRFSDGASEG
jgi:hypothetical protein